MGAFSAPARVAEFRDALATRALIADGAMGTMLISMLGSRGAVGTRCLDELNLSLPAMVRDVHQEYLRAGAQIFGTNTFGANRRRLGEFGFAEKTRAINQAGVRIAREAAREAFVAGVVGPLGARLQPLGVIAPAEARALFREQMDALVESGVDLLMLETFQDLEELRQAVFAARESAGPEMAIIAHVSIGADGTLACGASVAEFTRVLNEWPVDAIGLNCSSGPSAILEAAEQMGAWTNKPLSVLPNAGLPAIAGGRSIYPCSPDYLAALAPDFLRAGARIVGGCCGTTPEHIRQIREAVDREAMDGVAVEIDRAPAIIEWSADTQEEAPREAIPAASRSELGARLAAREFAGIVEVAAPRWPDDQAEMEAILRCKELGIGFLAISAGPGAASRLSAAAGCHLVRKVAGLECVLNLGGRNQDVAGLESDLLGAHALGIRNVLFDGQLVGAAAVASNLNRGLDLGGHSRGAPTSLLAGAVIDPWAADLEEELRHFELSVKAGADFAVTRPVYDLDLFGEFLKRVEPYQLPVIVGVRPLTSIRDAESQIHEHRTPVPPAYLERLKTLADGALEGLTIAREITQNLRGMAAGVYWSGRSGPARLAAALAEALGSQPMGSQR